MKVLSGVVLPLFLCTLCISCGNKQSSQEGAAEDSVRTAQAADAPYADPGSRNVFTAKLGGKAYDITIVRKADTALPVVTDDMGKRYYDNRVEVTIACEGKLFFSESYTKESFAADLSEAETKGAVLLGMAFDTVKSDDRNIYLGAQVGQIGLEEGPAFSVQIPLDGGKARIVRDNVQDTTGDDSMGD